MASQAVPGLLLCFLAFVMLVIVSLSVPTWDKVSFFDVTVRNATIKFGSFGYTGSSKRVGYTVDPRIFGLPANAFDNDLMHTLSPAGVLHPFAAALSVIAILFGFWGAASSRVGTMLMTLFAALAALLTTTAFAIEMTLWTTQRRQIHDAGAAANVTTKFGNANWLTLGALITLILALCAGVWGSCGQYRKKMAKFLVTQVQ